VADKRNFCKQNYAAVNQPPFVVLLGEIIKAMFFVIFVISLKNYAQSAPNGIPK
jgi:hypothetical protein